MAVEILLPNGGKHIVPPPEGLRERILKEKQPKELQKLADEVGVGVDLIGACIDELKQEGYGIGTEGEVVFRTKTPKEGVFFDLSEMDRHLHFGIVSDSHMSSKKERLDDLNAMYDIFETEGITMVFHVGDLTDGWGVYRGQEFEVKHFGQDEQIAYAADKYPKRKDINTLFITGNHDLRQYERGGVDPGIAIGNRREDMTYLGQINATVLFPNEVEMELLHPGGGTAYALSYKAQRFINNLAPKDVPQMLVYGHYHTAFYMHYRDVHFIQAPCFRGYVRITTNKGLKPIASIKVGDKVLTHKNRYKKVTKVFKRKYSGKFYRLYFGRKNRKYESLSGTAEHPVLIERNGKKQWIELQNVRTEDYVFIEYSKCKICNKKVPYWNNFCPTCSHMQTQSAIENAKKIKKKWKNKHPLVASAEKHIKKDVLPRINKLIKQGWKIVPTGGSVLPDAVGFKNGKVYLFEYENLHGESLERKKKKYKNSYINNYINGVKWIDTNPFPRRYNQRSFKIDKDNGFIKVRVDKITSRCGSGTKRIAKTNTVWNIEVEEDNTYFAGRMLVHNCFKDAGLWEKRLGLNPTIGGWIVDATISPQGNIDRFKPELFSF